MRYPEINYIPQSHVNIEQFGGYRHRLRIAENEWHDEKNIGSDDYPMFATRHLRGVGSAIPSLAGIITKDSLIAISGHDVISDGYSINLDLDVINVPKQLVSMGAYLIILPDKKYINTEDLTDYGSIEAFYTAQSGVSLEPCHYDGSAFSSLTVSSEQPADITTTWVDTSGTIHVYREWSASSETWVQLQSVYVKISAADIDDQFSKGDGVNIGGITGSEQLEALNGSHVIHSIGDGFIVITGLIDGAVTTESATSISRTMPDMDYVCEASNRLWGCKYGIVGGQVVNELYASKLGDFKNWNVYDGVSTDSWAASVGSDGQWTGAINYLGYPTFFKEERIHRIYPSSAGAHQVQETVCSGVQKGSWRSLCVCNEILFYKGRTNVYAYDGSQPTAISDAFGDVNYIDARAGAVRNKYYISMKNAAVADSNYDLFCYDAKRGIWHREDSTKALMFSACDDDLFFIDENAGKLCTVYGSEGTEEQGMEWYAESGVQNYSEVGHKYISRFNFRVQLPAGSSMHLYMRYDDGLWEDRGSFTGKGLDTYLLPVIPRRCDHLQFKLTGTGPFKLFGISKVYEQGSDEG